MKSNVLNRISWFIMGANVFNLITNLIDGSWVNVFIGLCACGFSYIGHLASNETT